MPITTACAIGIIQKDQTVREIYCHHAGYIEGVGSILYSHYFNKNKIEELLELGNISVLARKLYPKDDEVHLFFCPAKDVTIAYMRDRGRGHQQAQSFQCIEEFTDFYALNHCDFTYLYDERQQQWLYGQGQISNVETLNLLEDAIEKLYIKIKNKR